MNRLFMLLSMMLFGASSLLAQSPYLLRSTLGHAATVTAQVGDYHVQQSVGQQSVIGSYTKDGVVLRQGFLQPNDVFTGEKEKELGLKAVVYPVPFETTIYVDFDEEITSEIEVEIIDVLGKHVKSYRFTSQNRIQMLLSDLAPASYVIKIKANQKQFRQSIIKYWF